MTPAEVKGRLKAHGMAQKRALEDMDTLAWMVGSYAAHAYHNPKKYPKKPGIVARDVHIPDDEMEPEDIKDALTVFAQAHNAAEKGKMYANHT